MRIACLGGGPAGLYFAIAMKRRDPGHEIVVVERNRPYDTFGWGVVLSDETLANLAAADPESAETIRGEFKGVTGECSHGGVTSPLFLRQTPRPPCRTCR